MHFESIHTRRGTSCFSKRRGMVTHLPARFHILVTALRVRVTRPSRNAATNTLIELAASLVPTRLVLPLSDMQRQRHWWSRLRSPERNQTFRLSSENIGSIREACSRLQVVAFIVSVGDITNGIKAGIRWTHTSRTLSAP